MQPTETEIRHLIESNVRYIPGLNPNQPLACYDQAARAIAEKMAEGVVEQWEGVANTWVGPMTGFTYLEITLNDGRRLLEQTVEPDKKLDGQLVTVTVRTREASDGQG